MNKVVNQNMNVPTSSSLQIAKQIAKRDMRSQAPIPIILAISIGFLLIQDTLNTQFGIQGPATVLIAGMLCIITLTTLKTPKSALSNRALPVPMTVFLAWSAFLLVFNPRITGVQNWLVWFIFPLTIGVVYARSGPQTSERVYPAWKWLSLVAAIVYLGQVAQAGPGAQGFPYSDRGAGWLLLLALIWILPRTHTVGGSRIPIAILSLAIFLSLSRTPLAIVMILIAALIALRLHRRQNPAPARIAWRFLLGVLASASAFYVAINHIAILKERFTVGDGYSINGVTINSSGRDVLWSLTIHDWLTSPWIGHGPGAAQEMISQIFPAAIAHPHNEYLRFLDDTGVIGLAFWLTGMLIYLRKALTALRASKDLKDRALHLAAVLGLLVLLAGAITDNVTISVFNVMLVGSVLGLSFSAHERKLTESPDETKRLVDLRDGAHETRHSVLLHGLKR